MNLEPKIFDIFGSITLNQNICLRAIKIEFEEIQTPFLFKESLYQLRNAITLKLIALNLINFLYLFFFVSSLKNIFLTLRLYLYI